jgi:hypothetical protein
VHGTARNFTPLSAFVAVGGEHESTLDFRIARGDGDAARRPNVFGDAPGAHPAYLHARSDLRRAELLMHRPDDPNVTRDLDAAAASNRRW